MFTRQESFQPLSEQDLKAILLYDPVEKLGQNFLVDPAMVRRVVASTFVGADVVEIGCGPGNITKGIAQRADNVIGIEIYPDFAEAQQIILEGCQNVKIVNQNALKFNFEKWVDAEREVRHQVIGNIPYHISEPLLTLLAGVSDRLENITLLVGDNLATTMTMTNPADDRYTRLSFISSIFDVNRVAHVSRKCFWPVPRTDSDLISLSPSEFPRDGKTFGFQLKRKIVLSQLENFTLIKVINGFSAGAEGGKTLGKDISHRYDRRQTRTELKRMTIDLNRPSSSRSDLDERLKMTGRLSDRIQLPKEILSKPFGQLNNQEVRQLATAIDNL